MGPRVFGQIEKVGATWIVPEYFVPRCPYTVLIICYDTGFIRNMEDDLGKRTRERSLSQEKCPHFPFDLETVGGCIFAKKDVHDRKIYSIDQRCLYVYPP